MSAGDDFQAVWDRHVNRAPTDVPEALCPIARSFLARLHELIVAPLGETPSSGQIAQAKYLLQEEWHTWRRSIPTTLFRGINPSDHHQCLLDAYLETYEKLQIIEATRRRPNLISDYDDLTRPTQPSPAPPSPAPPPPGPPQIAGIFLGEHEDESV